MEAIFLESLFVEQIGAVVDRTIPRPPPPAVVLRYFYNTYNIFRISLQCGVRAISRPHRRCFAERKEITPNFQYYLAIFINSSLQLSLEKAHDCSKIIFRSAQEHIFGSNIFALKVE